MLRVRRAGFTSATLAIYTVWSLALPASVSGRELLFEDRFEHGLAHWQLQQGVPEYWIAGTGYIEGIAPRRNKRTELLLAENILPADLVEYELEVEYEPLAGFDRNFGFSFVDAQNWSELHFLPSYFEFARVEAGVASTLAFNFPFANDKQYTLKVISRKTELQVFIDGNKVLESTNPLHLTTVPNRPFLRVTAGTIVPTRVRFHRVSVWSVASEPEGGLPVLSFKQHDSEWGSLTYDNAQDWSTEPTMARWGCAVTSAAMLFRYYGLDFLPDGTALTPGSLNHWLHTQSDGYVGEGLTNWLALTRLSRLIASQFSEANLPTFEFLRISEQVAVIAQTYLENGQPIIGEIPGHFFVLTGAITGDPLDFFLVDPAFAYTRLSQHSAPLRSLRVLTPSHTDLSYILIVTAPESELAIRREDGSVPLTYDSYIEQSTSFDGDERGSPARITTVSQPLAGEYHISFSQQAAPMTIFAYSQDGTVLLQEHVPVEVGASELSIVYDPTATATFSVSSRWQMIAALLEWLRLENQTLPQMALRHLQRIAAYATQHPQADARYQMLFTKTAALYAQEYPQLCATLFSIMPEHDTDILADITSTICGTLSDGRSE